MKIGLLADLHLGYSHGTKTNKDGVNQREQDVIDAAMKAVDILIENKVDAIVDAGDLAHVPAPKKRALMTLFSMMERASPIKFYSVNGNHTLVRTNSDVHLYDVLRDRCENFRGYTKPTYVEEIRGYFVPYSTNSEEIREWLSSTPEEAAFVVGHWACDDVPFPGEHILTEELPNIPVFLGHYHTRKVGQPTYIGATERFAWGEWQNPTGVAIFEPPGFQDLEFIPIPTREWVDIRRTDKDYLDIPDVKDKITRVSITCSIQEYQQLDMVKLRKKLDGALEYQVRRMEPDSETEEEIPTILTASLYDSWKEHLSKKRMPVGISRREVEEVGSRAIATVTGR